MKTRRLVMASIVACLPIAAAVTPAGAIPPTRDCPPAFVGPLTFAEIIQMFPPPPDLPDPEGVLASFDLNGDASLCVRPLPPGEDINVIDNIAHNPAVG
jgi:hypothetical protein